MEKTIGFFTLGLPFDGKTVYEKSLGGSETALTYMAQGLAAIGNRVKVFCNCPSPGRYSAGPGNAMVDYHDIQDFNRLAPSVDWDVMIVSRYFQQLSRKFKSKLNILWNHDVLTNPGELMANVWKVDLLCCLSEYHKTLYTSQLPVELAPFIWQTKNGVDLRMVRKAVQGHATHRNKRKLIYAARPERGLLYLLETVMPLIWARFPDMKLYVAGYDLGNFPVDQRIQDLYRYLDELMTTLSGRVIRLGNLKKEDYYRHLSDAVAYVYPTDFPEISCISAMEAMACGAPFITTDDFALKETVPFPEYKVSAKISDPSYAAQFVGKLLPFLSDAASDRAFAKSLSEKAALFVQQNYDWMDVAKSWDVKIESMFQERAAANTKGIIKQLIYDSDIIAAKAFANEKLLQDPLLGLTIQEEADALTEFIVELETRSADSYDKEDGRSYATDPNFRTEKIPRIDAAAKMVRGPSVLDLGCHYGEGAIAFVNTSQNVKDVVAVDWSSGCIDMAKKAEAVKCDRQGIIQWKVGSWDSLLPEYANKFDTVFAGELMEHMEDPTAFIDTIEKYAKSGGKIILTLPSGPWEGGYKKPWDDRWHLWHFDWSTIYEVLGKKSDFTIAFLASGITEKGDLLGNYVISYTQNDLKPSGRINVARKYSTVRPYKSVSACIIAKNEEESIGRCIRSFLPVVDETFVLDTGSTDATAEIARKLGATVLQLPWPDDFAEARNASKAEATSDWIFWIDCDEVLKGAINLPKYLGSSIFNGFVIKQNHLTLDMQTKPDVPIRVFRNLPKYQFVGVIHEHCEDVSKGPWDNPIGPALILPDVDIIHFGYLNEYDRRQKCSERNLPLLFKDLRKNPGRKLGRVLLQRDYINMTHWEMEASNGRLTDKILTYLRLAIQIYRENFADMKNMYHPLSDPLYQHSLEILGQQGVPVTEGSDDIPFETAIVIGGALGGMRLPPGEKLPPLRRWFYSYDDFRTFILYKAEEFAGYLRLIEPKKVVKEEVADDKPG